VPPSKRASAPYKPPTGGSKYRPPTSASVPSFAPFQSAVEAPTAVDDDAIYDWFSDGDEDDQDDLDDEGGVEEGGIEENDDDDDDDDADLSDDSQSSVSDSDQSYAGTNRTADSNYRGSENPDADSASIPAGRVTPSALSEGRASQLQSLRDDSNSQTNVRASSALAAIRTNIAPDSQQSISTPTTA